MTVLAVIGGILIGAPVGAFTAQVFNTGADDLGFGAFMYGIIGAGVGAATGAILGAFIAS